MGQYHVIANFDKREYLKCPYGAKLMEISWQNNQETLMLEQLMTTSWKNDKVLVIGDYADLVALKKENLRGYLTLKELCEKYDYLNHTDSIYDYIYENFSSARIVPDKVENKKTSRYVINEESNSYIDLNDEPIQRCWLNRFINELDVYRIHPLPILLSISNGLGSGDYMGRDHEYAGYWSAFSKFSFSNEMPIGYKKLNAIFDEERYDHKAKTERDIVIEDIVKESKKVEKLDIDSLEICRSYLTEDEIKEIKELAKIAIENKGA